MLSPPFQPHNSLEGADPRYQSCSIPDFGASRTGRKRKTTGESEATDRAGMVLENRCAASDPLKRHANAPPGVQHYPGPYYTTLERLNDSQ
jgi:hypothetical protein